MKNRLSELEVESDESLGRLAVQTNQDLRF